MVLNDIFVVRNFTRLIPPTGNEQNGLNVLHYRVGAQVGAGVTELEAAVYFDVLFQQEYKNFMTVSASWRGCTVSKIEPLPVTEQAIGSNNVGNGLLIDDILAAFTCGMITKRTGLAGRRNRGRLYTPFPTESQNGADARPTPGYIASIALLGLKVATSQNIVAAGGQISAIPVIYHKGLIPRTTDVISTLSRNYWVTQRRRSTARSPDPLVF